MKSYPIVPLSRTLFCMASMVLGVGLLASIGQADTPPASVTTTTISPGQSYPEVPASGEGWFDVGGYCKVVDVGDLSALGPTAIGVPVFIPGPAAQWENYRTLAGTHYNGQLVLTTCCRPQSNIATLCTEDGATPVSVSRQYGKLGETDTVVATCNGANGPYQDSVSLLCSGDNGPDGQATWSESGPDSPTCTTAPTTTYGACSTAGVGGWGNQLATVTNCLGQVLSQSYSGPSCYTAPPCTPVYSYSCNQSNGNYVQTDTTCGTGSTVIGACSYNITTSTKSCGGFNYSDSYPDGACTISYKQCNDSGWGCGVDATCNEGCSTDGCSQSFTTHETCGGVTTNGGSTCPVYQYECSRGRYTYP
jgi:hypothetical protein